MKKIILIFMISLLSLHAISQFGFSLHLASGISSNNQVFSRWEKLSRTGTYIDAGGGVEYRLSEKIRVASGIIYKRINLKYRGTTSFPVISPDPYYLQVKWKLSYIMIPLQVFYFPVVRKGFFISAGLAPSFGITGNIYEKQGIGSLENPYIDSKYKVIPDGDRSPSDGNIHIKRMYYHLDLAAGYQYKRFRYLIKSNLGVSNFQWANVKSRYSTYGISANYLFQNPTDKK